MAGAQPLAMAPTCGSGGRPRSAARSVQPAAWSGASPSHASTPQPRQGQAQQDRSKADGTHRAAPGDVRHLFQQGEPRPPAHRQRPNPAPCPSPWPKYPPAEGVPPPPPESPPCDPGPRERRPDPSPRPKGANPRAQTSPLLLTLAQIPSRRRRPAPSARGPAAGPAPRKVGLDPPYPFIQPSPSAVRPRGWYSALIQPA